MNIGNTFTTSEAEYTRAQTNHKLELHRNNVDALI